MLEVGCLEYEQPIAMPKKLPLDLYRCAQVKSLDARAIADQTVSGFTLMTRAGQAASYSHRGGPCTAQVEHRGRQQAQRHSHGPAAAVVSNNA